MKIKSRRYKNKNRKIIIAFLITFILMSSGYAAFQTVINIKVTGHINVTPEECFTVSDNKDGTGTLTNYDMTCGKKVVIPDVINNLTITKIADYSETAPVFYDKPITYVKLPNHLTQIGSQSFYLSNLKNIKLPKSMKIINSRAFQQSKLTEIQLNHGLTTLKLGCLESNQLEHLSIPNTVKNLNETIAINNNISGDEAFIYKRDENGIIDYTTLISYGNGKTIQNIKIPEGIKTINDYAFAGMSIKTISLPETIEQINKYLVVASNNLNSIYIGKNIKYININAFKYTPTGITININRSENAISGAPWGATNATINWIGNS